MKIDEQTVDKLANLARLEFKNEEKTEIVSDLNKMLEFVEKLNEVDTEGVEPLKYVNEDTNVMRDDVVRHDISQEKALKNAPNADSDYFKIAKVIENPNN